MALMPRLLPPTASVIKIPIRTHFGYMPFEGRFGNHDNEFAQLVAVKKSTNLKPVAKIHFKFDPIHPKSKYIRDAMHYLSLHKVRATNPKCIFKTDIVSDRSEGTCQVTLDNGNILLFKMGHLSALEMMQIMNKHVLPLVKQEKEAVVASKGAAKIAGGKKK